jgi:uncharacterized repeat protein (TIGR01451 family)
MRKISSAMKAVNLVIVAATLFCLCGSEYAYAGPTLNSQTAYPDTNICHLNANVNFIGQVQWTNYSNLSYSVHADYGDGGQQTITKTTINLSPGQDSFKLVHSYATAGMMTVKIVLKNNLNVPVDSIIRQYNVGACAAASGYVYFDCIENCTKDSTEMGMFTRFMKFYRNGVQRLYWLDTGGAYNIPIFPGDTVTPTGGMLDYPSSYVSSCSFPAITGATTNRDLAIRLYDPISFNGLTGNQYFCTGISINHWSFNITYPPNNPNSWWAKIDFGNGTWSGFFWTPNQPSYSTVYNTAGTYDVKYYLYTDGQYGPLMRMKRQAYATACPATQVNLYFDQNANCTKDAGEETTRDTWAYVKGKLSGTANIYVDTAGQYTTYVYPGDTIFVDTALTVYYGGGWSLYTTVKTNKLCAAGTYYTSVAGNVYTPYKPKVKIISAAAATGYCKYDTVRFDLNTYNLGLQSTTVGKLYAWFGDGTMDSVNLSFATDTLAMSISHPYTAAGTVTPTFVLKWGTATDTFSINHTVGNCYTIYVKAYRDSNRNCVRDGNESFVPDFNVALSNNNIAFSNNTGIASGLVFYGVDSAVSVMTGTPAGECYRSWNKYFCPWPLFTTPLQVYELPLDDTIHFTASVYDMVPVCDSVSQQTLVISHAGNYVHDPYYAIYQYGDGATEHISMGGIYYPNQYFNPSPHTYQPGTYYQGVQVFDSLAGIMKYSFQVLYPLEVMDTCSVIKGRAFYDMNADCADNAEPGIANVMVKAVSNGVQKTTWTDQNGDYHIAAVAGNSYTVSFPALLANGDTLACIAASQTVSFTGTTILKAAYQCSTATQDVSILASHHAWQPSASDTISLYVQNAGCASGGGTLKLTLDNSMSFVAVSLAGVQQTGQQLVWNVANLSQLPAIVEVAVSLSGSATGYVCVPAEIQSTAIDPNLSNNLFVLCDSVKLFLPNAYKSASNGNLNNGPLQQGDEIVYTLGFKNNSGNVVTNVILLDTLSALLDINTLQPLSGTLPYQLSLLSGNVLKVEFANAVLQPGDEGYFSFSVKPVLPLPLTAVIPNSFSVIMGSGFAGTSNKTTILNYDPAGVEVTNAEQWQIAVYPNPAMSYFNVEMKGWSTASLEITDARGALATRCVLHEGSNTVSTSGLAAGVYMLRFVSKDRITVRKVVVK